MLGVLTPQDGPFPPSKNYPFTYVWGSIIAVMETVDVFKKYDSDKLITGLGLSVLSKYRGRSIGLNILKARYILIN